MSSFYYPDSPPKILMEVLKSNFKSLGRKVADAPRPVWSFAGWNTHLIYAEPIILTLPYMRRLLPKAWCIVMCSITICGYSRDFTFYESASAATYKLAFFQGVTITGKVVDETGVGMPGVNVIVKGTSNRYHY